MVLRLLIFFSVFPFLSSAQVQFPSYKEVVRHCFQQYQGGGVPTFRLIKHPTGYKAIFPPSEQPILVWSPEQKWLPIEVVDRASSGAAIPQEVFSASEIDRYVEQYLRQHALTQAESDRLPYYGYRGYYKDIIRVLEPAISKLQEADLHSLARAYSAAASALLHDNTSFSDSTELFPLVPGRGVLTKEQVEGYRLAHQKAVDTYRQLVLQNPDFPTPVGTVRVKYAHEVMDGYLQLLYFQGEEAAKSILKAGIYEESFLTLPRNILQSCPSNAVLITYGDGDTYPLLYLQAVEKVRMDVRVVNSSLLALPRYAQYVYDGTFGQLPMRHLLPSFFFQKLIVLEQTERNPTNTVAASTFLGNLSAITPSSSGNGYELAACSIPSLELPSAPAQQLLPGNRGVPILWKPKSTYLTMEAIVPVDILAANAWNFPLCFSPTCAAAVLAPWQGHLALEGMIFRVVSHQLPTLNWEATPIHLERSVQLFQEAFLFPSLQRSLREEEFAFYQYWLLTHQQVVRGLIKVNQLEEAARMADVLNRSYNEKMAPRGFLWIPLVEQYAQCGKIESAQSLAKQIATNFLNGRLTDFEMRGKVEGLEKLQIIAKKYQFSID